MSPELPCPICGGSAHPAFSRYDYMIFRCTCCGHRFADITNAPEHTEKVYVKDDGYFFSGGSGYLDYTSEAELLIAHGERYARILRRYTGPGRVFDVGAAAGFILEGLIRGGWKGRGIEPNPTMAEHARRQSGVAVETGIFENFETTERFDLVTMIQVIAHFHDVRKALAITREILDQNGLLLVETWDRESWPARLMGPNWHHYSPPSVVNWFSASGLTSLVRQFGFSEVARGRPAKWISGSHAKSLVKFKSQGLKGGGLISGIFGLLPDRLRLPYPSWDLFWSLYRKEE